LIIDRITRVPGYLLLADGSYFSGNLVLPEPGLEPIAAGAELVFNTAMSGYQEALTDPSYFGQMLLFTTAHIGNYGITANDDQSERIWAAAALAPNYTAVASNFAAKSGLCAWLYQQGKPLFTDFDARKVVRKLRTEGAMPACVAADLDLARDLIADVSTTEGSDLVLHVTRTDELHLASVGEPITERPLVVMDFGVKKAMIESLLGPWEVVVVPANTPISRLREFKPACLFLSNGPGDPAALDWAVDITRNFLGQVPIAGICLGHQVICRALGARTYRLEFGHHGSNHPVKDLATGKVSITAQNHNYAVDRESLKEAIAKVTVTKVNLFDNVVEGMEATDLGIVSVQYHPEAAPGPTEERSYMAKKIAELV
jgi:carbamoyl-phosphate synthase small subunit